MDALLVEGGTRLAGTAPVSGSKNAGLLALAATLLAEEPVEIRNLPPVADVATMRSLLARLDSRLEPLAGGGLGVTTPDSARTTADYDLVRRMRAGVSVLGPLVARRGRAVVALPGGCRLGERPIDLHLAGLAALGADVRTDRGYVWVEARRLRGAEVDLAGPRGSSVTATANVLCAAVRATGTTVVRHAAREPEIVDLGRLLTALGARIEGLGTETLVIAGVPHLGGAVHGVGPDRIEAATLLLAGLITGGDVSVFPVVPAELASVLERIAVTGAVVEIAAAASEVRVRVAQPLRAVAWQAEPWPGLPTDLQPLWTALATQLAGTTTIRDRVFPERFAHLAELTRLGASATRHGDTARVNGPTQLRGAPVRATDLRAAAALVLAGLVAEGVTRVENVEHLDRGYHYLERKLAGLGARVARVTSVEGHATEPRPRPAQRSK